METQLPMFLDPSGFLRRECPTCEREFKLFHGKTEAAPEHFLEPENYTCPYCGVPASHDSWFTRAQLEYARSASVGPIMRHLEDELRGTFDGKTTGFRFEVSSSATDPLPPPVDPDDMMMVEPPCHPFEPLKVAEDWDEPLHCLMCGQRFRV